MPPPPHYRMTATGILGDDPAGSEIWSCNISIGPPTGTFLTQPELPAVANAMFPHWVTLFNAITTTQVRLDKVRIANVGPDGKVPRDVAGAFVQGDSTAAPARVGGGTGKVPFQVSLALSLTTAFSGPTGRGRIFVPCPLFTVGGQGQLVTATVAVVAGATRTFVNSINASMVNNGGGRVCIASGGSPTKALAPGLRPVTGVRVGTVLDTQRRRRNALVETYSSLAL